MQFFSFFDIFDSPSNRNFKFLYLQNSHKKISSSFLQAFQCTFVIQKRNEAIKGGEMRDEEEEKWYNYNENIPKSKEEMRFLSSIYEFRKQNSHTFSSLSLFILTCFVQRQTISFSGRVFLFESFIHSHYGRF